MPLTQPQSEACKNCFLIRENPHSLPSTVKKLAELRSVRTYKPNQAILSQGSVPTQICCLAKGSVTAQYVDNTGESEMLFSFRDRGFFPTFAFFSKSPSVCEFQSKGKTTICQFPATAFDELLSKDAGLTKKLFEACSLQSLKISGRIMALLGKSAELKVARTIFQARDEQNFCPMSRKEIAKWTNVAAETVVRALSTLEKKNLVRRSRAGIQITDSKKMLRYLGE